METEAHELQPDPADQTCGWEDDFGPVGDLDIWIVILAAFIIGMVLG